MLVYVFTLASANDPLRFKPNPSNLLTKLVDDDGIVDGESQTQESKIYVPPKALSVPFNEKPQKAKQRIRPRAALMEELKEEVLGMPREMKVGMNKCFVHSIRYSSQFSERQFSLKVVRSNFDGSKLLVS